MQQKKLTTLCLFGGLVVATTNSWKSALAAAIDNNNNKKNGEVDAATLELGVRVGADDAAVVAGAAEEEDFCDEASDCALELKQLRALKVHTAAQASEEVADTAAGALFGPEAVGVNMWTPESWARSLDLLEKSHSNTSAGCELQTGATCAIFSCKESRGPTECKDLLCQCASGWCAKDGICLPSLRAVCLTDSGGTCYADGCDASRGPQLALQGSAFARLARAPTRVAASSSPTLEALVERSRAIVLEGQLHATRVAVYAKVGMLP
eukprot:CAMPEP_0206456964 /NCGR_PEP_ID=MMETSP0324_2-20121206/22677_1 /ASSEMBLY_ACC=CAM_ASM_000836 /TAXON_ID=2866 /ORGANISM="Crypthecodinium cohnii, Strain Seligo" /LENGTH=266 /DNA_ID=CAMNT_0053927991 /DNA_START=206 /DNA_END=1007 /DNA_ORIENTATION=-